MWRFSCGHVFPHCSPFETAWYLHAQSLQQSGRQMNQAERSGHTCRSRRPVDQEWNANQLLRKCNRRVIPISMLKELFPMITSYDKERIRPELERLQNVNQ